jgi:hypothetical protein
MSPNHIHPAAARHRRQQAMSLVEALMAMAIGSVVLAMVGWLTVYGARSFAVLGNYSALDQQSRIGIDKMTRQIRQATAVLEAQGQGSERWLVLTNETEETGITYYWSADSRRLVAQSSDEETEVVLLNSCDDWSFELGGRVPMPGETNAAFPPASLRLCRLINMSWSCSRYVLSTNLINSETMQDARIVLRNQQSP